MLLGVATEFEVAAAEVLDERLAAPALWSSRDIRRRGCQNKGVRSDVRHGALSCSARIW
jgi:hypothetical protein